MIIVSYLFVANFIKSPSGIIITPPKSMHPINIREAAATSHIFVTLLTELSPFSENLFNPESNSLGKQYNTVGCHPASKE